MEGSNGRLLTLEGQLYYSPNCSRTVELPPLLDVPKGTNLNPFTPGRPWNDLRAPCRWNHAYGWSSFIPLDRNFSTFPFDHLEAKPAVELEDGLYSLKTSIFDNYSTISRDLERVAHVLFRQYDPPTVFPYPVRTWGFDKFYKSQAKALALSFKSRDWFLVWIGLVSFLVASAETKDKEYVDFMETLDGNNLGAVSRRKTWQVIISEHTGLRYMSESLPLTPVCAFNTSTRRCGVFLDLDRAADDYQPSVRWFVSHGVPVWFPWNGEVARFAASHQMTDLVPPPHLLQSKSEFLLATPTAPVPPDTTPCTSSMLTPDQMCRLEDTARQAEIKDLVERYEARARTKRERQTPQEKEAAEARRRENPTTSAVVHRYEVDLDDPSKLKLEVVSKKWRNQTLFEHTNNQKVYFPDLNIWIICEDLAPGESIDDNEDDDEFAVFAIPPPPQVPPLSQPTSLPQFQTSTPSPPHDMPTTPTSITSPPHATPTTSSAENRIKTTSTSSTLEQPSTTIMYSSPGAFIDRFTEVQNSVALEETLLDFMHLFYGFLSPIPFPSGFRGSPEESAQLQNVFLRCLGVSPPAAVRDELMRHKIAEEMYKFFKRCISQSAPPPDKWDLSPDSLRPPVNVRLLRRLVVIPRPQKKGFYKSEDLPSCWYLFNFNGSHFWNLAVTNASDALTVCRLERSDDPIHVAMFLVRRGIPFQTFQVARQSPQNIISTRMPPRIPSRPPGYRFTHLDYSLYLYHRDIVLNGPHMRAALLQGGIAWRLVYDSFSVDDIIEGPTGRGNYVFYHHGQPHIDDTLSTLEEHLLVGAYVCYTGNGTQTAIRSWWPLIEPFENGEYHGRWTHNREQWYQERLCAIESGKAEPKSVAEWRDYLKGRKEVKQLRMWTEKASRRYLSSAPL